MTINGHDIAPPARQGAPSGRGDPDAPRWELVRKFVQDAYDMQGGDPGGTLTLAINSVVSVLSSIHDGNREPMAYHMERLMNGIIRGIRNEDIPVGYRAN